MTAASLSPTATPAVELNAVAYRKAHTGKLMLISRADGREQVTTDFFRFDAVGTHPTGLIVTGIFADGRRSHMQASSVRDANEAEIAGLIGLETFEAAGV